MNPESTKPKPLSDKQESIPEILVSSLHWPMLLLGAATVVAGTAAARFRGNMELLPASLCLIFTLFSQVAGTYWYNHNEVHRRGTDDEVDSRFSRLSRSSVFREAAAGLSSMGGIIGLALIAMAGWWAIVPAVLLIAITYVTFSGAHPLSRSPWGLISTFLLFGPVGVIGCCLIQSGHEAYSLLNFYDVEPSLYIAGIMGLMALNANLIHNVANITADRKIGKTTFPVRFGIPATRIFSVVNSLIWLGLCWCLFRVQHIADFGVAMIVPYISLAINVLLTIRMRDGSMRREDAVQFTANINMLVMAVALLIIAFYEGASDDSAMNFI